MRDNRYVACMLVGGETSATITGRNLVAVALADDGKVPRSPDSRRLDDLRMRSVQPDGGPLPTTVPAGKKIGSTVP